MTEPLDEDVKALLTAARDDKPAHTDEERLERRVLGAIAAGTVATVVMPTSKAAALARALLSKPVAAFGILIVGAGMAAWVATHDSQRFLAHPAVHAPATTAPRPAAHVAPPPVPRHVVAAPAPPQHIVSPTHRSAPNPPNPRSAVRSSGDPSTSPAPAAAQPEVALPATGAERPTDATSSPSPAPTPVAEVTLLARARAALRQGDAAAALAAVAAHDAQYPAGQFSEELDVLRVEALATAGREADARARATQFARQWPGSTYAERVRRAVGTGTP